MTAAPATAIRTAAPAVVRPSLFRVFRAASKSEWTKLRTVRSTVWALVITVISMIGLGALLTALEVSRWDHRSVSQVAHFDPLLYSFAGINLAQLSIGVLGVLVMSSEYASGGIRLTLAATPQRTLLLAAKVMTFGGVVAVVSLVACVASFGIGQAVLAQQGGGVSIGDPGVLRALLGGAAYLVLDGAIAVGFGALLRHTAAAVAALFAVLLVIPGLVMLLPSPWNDDITKLLPGAAGEAMAATVRFPNLLGPGIGCIVLCGYTLLVLGAATVVLSRRDA